MWGSYPAPFCDGGAPCAAHGALLLFSPSSFSPRALHIVSFRQFPAVFVWLGALNPWCSLGSPFPVHLVACVSSASPSSVPLVGWELCFKVPGLGALPKGLPWPNRCVATPGNSGAAPKSGPAALPLLSTIPLLFWRHEPPATSRRAHRAPSPGLLLSRTERCSPSAPTPSECCLETLALPCALQPGPGCHQAVVTLTFPHLAKPPLAFAALLASPRLCFGASAASSREPPYLCPVANEFREAEAPGEANPASLSRATLI